MNSNKLLQLLTAANVEFVVVGGLAATVHGSSYVTSDLDVCTSFTQENIARILHALNDLNPKNRMRPDRPPLRLHASEYAGLKNLYVWTDLGQLDFLGEIAGVGEYAACFAASALTQFDDFSAPVLSAEALIRSKRTLARPKDLLVARELELLHNLAS